MSISLYDLFWRTATYLEHYIEGRSTAGSTNYIEDTYLLGGGVDDLGYAADQLAGGTLLTSALPSGKVIRQIASYAPSTARVTTASAASGTGFSWNVDYLILHRTFPAGIVISKINEALQEIGDVVWEDISLTTAASTRRYSITFVDTLSDQRHVKLLEVWLATNTAEPYGWERALGVRRVWPRLTGNNEALIIEFPSDPVAGRLIKIVYSFKPYVFAQFNPAGGQDFATPTAGGTLEGRVDEVRVCLDAATRCVRWRINQAGDDSGKLTSLLNDLTRRLAERRSAGLDNRPPPQPVLPFTEVR